MPDLDTIGSLGRRLAAAGEEVGNPEFLFNLSDNSMRVFPVPGTSRDGDLFAAKSSHVRSRVSQDAPLRADWTGLFCVRAWGVVV